MVDNPDPLEQLVSEHRADLLVGVRPMCSRRHQQDDIVVVDDAVAFIGGADFGCDRWDTSLHLDADLPGRHQLLHARTRDGRVEGVAQRLHLVGGTRMVRRLDHRQPIRRQLQLESALPVGESNPHPIYAF